MARDELARVREAYDRMARDYDRDMERGLSRRLVRRARPRVGPNPRAGGDGSDKVTFTFLLT